MDFEIRSGDKYYIDDDIRWRITRIAEVTNLAHRLPSEVHVPDRTYKAFISLINEELWRIDSNIKDIKKHPHIPSTV